jgi:phage baseplate assembly protein V
MLEQRVRRLERALARLIVVGVVTEVDPAARRVKVKVGDRLSPWLRWSTGRAGDDVSWDAPSDGEQVLVLSPMGDLSLAVVGDSLYQQDADPEDVTGQVVSRRFGNGTEVSLDKQSNLLSVKHPGKVVLDAGGDLDVKVGGDITIEASGSVKIKGTRVDIN